MSITSILIGFLIGVIFTIVFYPKEVDEVLIQRISELNDEISWWIKAWKYQWNSVDEMVKVLKDLNVDTSKWEHQEVGDVE